MIEAIKNWKGAVEIDGSEYKSVSEVPESLTLSNNSYILLKSNKKVSAASAPHEDGEDDSEYMITVKQYMTKKSTPSFDFMAHWNNNVPMPLRTMVGVKLKETRGMVYMKLHACTTFKTVQYCMKCGRVITNPVSKYFGLGPECGGHNYVNPFNSEEELNKAVEDYKKTVLSKITWEGWIIRSAIERCVKV